MDKIFILCLGSPKTGTTSLYNALGEIPGVDFGLIKEYHVLDALYVKECRFFWGRHTWDKCEAKRKLRFKMQSDLDIYFEYFAGLLYSRQAIGITGDFTPTHLLLTKSVIEEVVARFSLKGVKVKLLFLMRDPLEQYWSGIRMNRRNAVNGSLFSRLKLLLIPEIVHMCINLFNPYYRMQHRYEIPLKNLAYFNSKDILVLNQEQLSRPDLNKKLADFLEISMEDFLLGKKNVTQRTLKSLPDWFQRLFVLTRWKTYSYCLSSYPEIYKLWFSSRFHGLHPKNIGRNNPFGI